MKIKGILAISLAAVLGTFLVSGCCCPTALTDQLSSQVGDQVKKSVEKGIKDTTGATINTDKTKDTTGEDLTSVPRYPDSTRTQYVKVPPNNGIIGITLTYETADDAAKVIAWYKDKMPGLGWTLTSSGSYVTKTETLSYGKSENSTTAVITVSNITDKTYVSVSYYGPEAGA